MKIPPSSLTNSRLEQLMKDSKERLAKMTPLQKALMYDEQKRSFVRGNLWDRDPQGIENGLGPSWTKMINEELEYCAKIAEENGHDLTAIQIRERFK